MSEIARSQIGVATYLIPTGSLNDPAPLKQLAAAIDACAEDRQYELVLDLAHVPLVDSECLEFFLDTQDRLTRKGGCLRLANPNAVLRDVLRLTRVEAQVEVVSSEDDADEKPGDKSDAPRERIGEMLRRKGLVSDAIIEEALTLQGQTGRRMAQILVEKGWVAEGDLLATLGNQLGIPFVWLRPGVYDPRIIPLVDSAVARRLVLMPLFRVRGVLYVATADPQSLPSIETVEEMTECEVAPVLACTDEILTTLGESPGEVGDLSEFMGEIENDLELVETAESDDAAIDRMAEGSPVINLINGLIQRAVSDGASDIHIEPSRKRCRVRLRIDGALYTVMTPPMEVHPALVSRLKVMAHLDIAERRLPQDGRLQVVTRGRVVDLRFSSLPGIFGEKIVLRVLDKANAILDIERLGLSDANREVFDRLLKRSYGLLLVTGPTGSGKSTTLYAGLSHLNSEDRNIVTIEDPVEYQIDTINQNQVRENIGLGFARILKHVLRQDPDIVMVGEIRERETAEIAVQAALTGHLVLSTLHTNDSLGAITRLLDMKIEPYLLSSALVGVMAQRLVRTICADCKTESVVQAETLAPYGVEKKGRVRLARGRGCASCYDSGYRGRRAIHEIIETSPELQRLIAENPSRGDLDAFVQESGLRTLTHDGMQQVLDGQTSIEEVLRVVNS